eukprot:64141-Prymnesium_polylepis.2
MPGIGARARVAAARIAVASRGATEHGTRRARIKRVCVQRRLQPAAIEPQPQQHVAIGWAERKPQRHAATRLQLDRVAPVPIVSEAEAQRATQPARAV